MITNNGIFFLFYIIRTLLESQKTTTLFKTGLCVLSITLESPLHIRNNFWKKLQRKSHLTMGGFKLHRNSVLPLLQRHGLPRIHKCTRYLRKSFRQKSKKKEHLQIDAKFRNFAKIYVIYRWYWLLLVIFVNKLPTKRTLLGKFSAKENKNNILIQNCHFNNVWQNSKEKKIADFR